MGGIGRESARESTVNPLMPVAAAPFSLTTLGELRLTGSAGPLLVGRRKELVLLSYVARRGPKPVQRDELAALLWGQRDEDKARQSLRHALHQLRRALGDAVEATNEYVRVPDGMIDVDATLLETDIAAGRLAEGLERWAGDFLRGAEDVGGGEDYTAWLERERESLRRTAVVGFTRIVDQERAANNSPDLLRWTRRWAERFPNDETAHLRLIDALQRNNDLNEARNIYADFVARLKAELDVTPSIELIRLGEQLSKATQKERDRRPGSGAIVAPELVGRGAAVVASLVELWSRARAEGSAVVIEGERGTGKTRLCAELAQRVRGDHAPALVLDVRADDSDLSTTWSTLRRIMAGLVRSSAIEDAPNKALVELADMLPDLRARFPHLGASSGSADRAESALSDVLRVVGAHAPVLMIVDDAEFADADSHRLIKRLMANVLPGTMIVLALDPARDGGVERASELAEIPGVRRFKLAMLTEEETGALVDSMLEIAPADRAAVVGRVYRESGGSPQRATGAVSAMTGNGELTLDQRGLWGMGKPGEGGKGTGDGGTATTLVPPSPIPHPQSPILRRLLVAAAGIVLFIAAIPLVRARASSSKTVDDPSVAPRVAVLDLELTGADTADAYLASGLAEEINSTLSRFEELRIKSRGSVRTARRAGLMDAVKLGEALQVDYLVEGSVRHVGDSFKIAVRLTKTSDGFQVWSKDFDASASALPAMHERIASEVASRIGGRLTRVELASTRRLPTSDAQAYEHYLRGNYFLGRRTPPFVEQAIAQYRLAVARDSAFAAAHARIGYSYALLLDWGWAHAGKSPEQLLHEGLELVNTATKLDSTSADTWMARAYLLEAADPVHMAGAAEAFERAIAIDPRNTEAIHQYAQVHEALGNWDPAMAAFRRTLLLEPDRSLPYVAMASIQWKRGQPAEARRLYDTALVLDPGASYVLSARALLRLHQGDVKGGLEDAETAVHVEDGYSIPPHSVLAIALARSGAGVRAGLEVDRALSEVPDPSSPSPTDARFIASALLAVGRRNDALDLLERARPRGAWLWFYALAPDFDPVKSDPRFIRVMREAHPDTSSTAKR